MVHTVCSPEYTSCRIKKRGINTHQRIIKIKKLEGIRYIGTKNAWDRQFFNLIFAHCKLNLLCRRYKMYVYTNNTTLQNNRSKINQTYPKSSHCPIIYFECVACDARGVVRSPCNGDAVVLSTAFFRDHGGGARSCKW